MRIGSFTLTDEEVARRKRYLEIGPADERRLADAHPKVQSQSAEIIARFYDYLLSHGHTRAMLEEPGLLPRLEELQGRYFQRLTSGRYDLDYFEDRLRVGLAHQRIGLSPEWYLGAYVKYLHIVSDVLTRAFGRDYEGFFQTLVSLTKVIYLDMGLALDAYHHSTQESLQTQAASLQEANSELQRVQAAKQQLADLIVHDLQNPVAGIKAVLQILADDPGAISAERRDVIREALRRCDDLSAMILNVLHVSRAEEGRLEPRLETVELSRLVEDIARAYEPVAASQGRVLSVESRSTVELRTDASLVKRILENLIRNAVRHTPAGTTVVVALETDAAGSAVLSVTDDGPGIPIEVQPLLFEPHGAAAALRAAGRQLDTGLGLASCRAAARALGTDIVVESDGRRGTRFSVLLPVPADANRGSGARGSARNRGGP